MLRASCSIKDQANENTVEHLVILSAHGKRWSLMPPRADFASSELSAVHRETRRGRGEERTESHLELFFTNLDSK